MYSSPSLAGAAAGNLLSNGSQLLCACRQHQRPSRPGTLRIYEAHVGMSSEEPAVASYTYFKGDRSPKLHKLNVACVTPPFGQLCCIVPAAL